MRLKSAAEKALALVAKGKVNWKKYYNWFTNNGRIRNFAGYNRKFEVEGKTISFHLHHIIDSILSSIFLSFLFIAATSEDCEFFNKNFE